MTSPTPEEKLKLADCPFCGEPPFAPIYDDHPINKWLVICDECETEGPHKHTEAEAITAWNRRSPFRREVLEEAARP